MKSETPLIHCPLVHVTDFEPCPVEELEPLRSALLADNHPATEQSIEFQRGTLLPDGRLDLCKQSVGPSGIEYLGSALRETDKVQSLLMGTDGLGDTGIKTLLQIVPNHPSLETLYLGCNKITGKGTEAIAETLENSPNIKALWLKRNPIGDDGAKAIAQLLRNNTDLETIDLVNTGFSDAGYTAIVSAMIESNRTIKHLYLGSNGLQPVAAELLAELLATNDQLESLLLNVNHLGDEGTQLLIKGLAKNDSLRYLGLGSNGIGVKGIKSLASVELKLRSLDLGSSRSCKVLGASNNEFGDSGAEVLARIIEQTPSLQSIRTGFNQLSEVGGTRLLETFIETSRVTDLKIEPTTILSEKNRKQYHRTIEERLEQRYFMSHSASIKSVYRTPVR